MMDSTNRAGGLGLTQITRLKAEFRPIAREMIKAFHLCAPHMNARDQQKAGDLVRNSCFEIWPRACHDASVHKVARKSIELDSRVSLWVLDCLFPENHRLNVRRMRLVEEIRRRTNPTRYPSYHVPEWISGVHHNGAPLAEGTFKDELEVWSLDFQPAVPRRSELSSPPSVAAATPAAPAEPTTIYVNLGVSQPTTSSATQPIQSATLPTLRPVDSKNNTFVPPQQEQNTTKKSHNTTIYIQKGGVKREIIRNLLRKNAQQRRLLEDQLQKLKEQKRTLTNALKAAQEESDLLDVLLAEENMDVETIEGPRHVEPRKPKVEDRGSAFDFNF